jgi:murein DD-endopeptidase MepM/ murein hydrolase activator NlpD
MKRTSLTSLMASSGRLRSLVGGFRKGPLWLAGAFVLCGIAMFLLGRNTAPTPEDLTIAVRELQLQLRLQQGAVDRLATNNRRGVNALAVRLAELQAASTRLDALGERLAQIGQLSLDEFDFSTPAPVGGPEEYEALRPTGGDELRTAIDALAAKLRRQSSQLDALQFLMVNRQLENDLTPSGWPVRKGWISSRYGERSDPFTGERVQHKGLDFAGTRGTEVLSVASGVVIWKRWPSRRAITSRRVRLSPGWAAPAGHPPPTSTSRCSRTAQRSIPRLSSATCAETAPSLAACLGVSVTPDKERPESHEDTPSDAQ